MNALKYIVYSFISILITTTVFAQFPNLDIYNNNTGKKKRKYDKYDLDKFLNQEENLSLEDDENEELNLDSLTVIDQVRMTPEQLKKLGVPDEVIEELKELNATGDSLVLKNDKAIKEQQRKLLGNEIDSIRLEDVQALIELRKKEIIERALKLPEPIVYGHEFFRRVVPQMLFEREMNPRASDDYILGTGDEISVSMWGKKDYNQNFTIDKQGLITEPLVGRINLKGLTYGAARKLLTQKFATIYFIEPTNIAVALNFNRIISVNFSGELLNPGAYRFPAATSILNALIAISGPNQLGSMRNIYIKRSGNVIKTFDVYKYMTDPSSQENFFLMDNDYVVVPAQEKIVNIDGQIRRPHNYELKNTEGLLELIDFAAGLGGAAFTKNINVKRYEDNKEVLIDVNLDELRASRKKFALQEGDSIFIYRIPQRLRNYVQVVGATGLAGRFEIQKGDKVSDVLYKTQGVLEDADLNYAYVLRLKDDLSRKIIPFKLGDVLKNPNSPENLVLQNLDTLQIKSLSEFRQDFTVKISGAVGKEGEYAYAEGLTLRTLLYLAGGMKKEAANTRIEISRVKNFVDDVSGKPTLERIVIKRIAVNPDLNIDQMAQSFELKPYDHIFIRFSPDFEEQQIVKLYGEVVYPGEYSLLNKKEKITSVIERAGGLTEFAFQEGGKLYRKEDSVGHILLNLDEAFQQPDSSKFNYILFANDSIFIPKARNLVSITGAIRLFEVDSLAKVNVPYEKEQNAKYYIEMYGAGYSRFAKRSRTYVEQPNGKIEKSKNMLLFNIHPIVENGATVFVDLNERKILREQYRAVRKEKRSEIDWNEAFNTIVGRLGIILSTTVSAIILAREL